ncbi:hypothetical protein TrRE_jg5136 [Triparma retinervis]|uniref:Uncharacterized protein n=1 Tax=Triparma retinervis TaxID=2557542 RepID=A0A9W7DQG5_9STRA|nr:hypothetical protein TrRE_jg5136 [Triparma retinervis]
MVRLSVENAAEQIEARNLALEDFLPLEFFDVREEISPKAATTTLIKWGGAVYAMLFVLFIALFATEITKETKSSTTTIEASPIVDARHANVVCSPLSTFAGSEDVMCASSFSFPNRDRFFVSNDPYGEGMDGFVSCGSFVRATQQKCTERVAELDVCNGYAKAVEENSVCRANPGGVGVYLDWSDNGQLKTIRKEVNLDDLDIGEPGFRFMDEYTGPFPGEKSIYTVSKNSLSFGLSYTLGMNEPRYCTQDGTGSVAGEGVSNCGVTQDWIADCETFWANACERVGIFSGPYACTETVVAAPTFFEALGTAYANLAFFSSLMIPLVVMLMVKLEERRKQGLNEKQPIPPSSPIHNNKL